MRNGLVRALWAGTVIVGVLAVAAWLKHRGDVERAARAPLTVGETLGAAFLGDADGNAPNVSFAIFSRAHPDAKQQLYALLGSQSSEVECNVYVMLGYLGDASDVRELERRLSTYSGRVRGDRSDAVRAIFLALGLLLRRDVQEALPVFDTLLSREYWQTSPIQWLPPDVPLETDDADEGQWNVLRGYAIAERNDLAQRRQAVVDSGDGPEKRRVLALRNDMSMLRELPVSVRQSEARGIDPTMRDWLARHGGSRGR